MFDNLQVDISSQIQAKPSRVRGTIWPPETRYEHPRLETSDLDYTREVLQPHLGATDMPTLIPCLFGDPAAHALGYPPQGLSPRAGLALALSEAQLGARSPDSVLIGRWNEKANLTESR